MAEDPKAFCRWGKKLDTTGDPTTNILLEIRVDHKNGAKKVRGKS
jgi:hypothetical protein